MIKISLCIEVGIFFCMKLSIVESLGVFDSDAQNDLWSKIYRVYYIELNGLYMFRDALLSVSNIFVFMYCKIKTSLRKRSTHYNVLEVKFHLNIKYEHLKKIFVNIWHSDYRFCVMDLLNFSFPYGNLDIRSCKKIFNNIV